MGKTIYRKDYQKFAYAIESTDLILAFDPDATRVTSQIDISRHPDVVENTPLVLNGHGLKLCSVRVDNRILSADDYILDDETLTIPLVSAQARIEIVTEIAPSKNTAFEGLYLSNGLYCTQCEAEGFRRITYYPDRPDVLAKFRVRLEGDKTKQPILLAGGNLVASGALEGNRHYAVFEDPFPKPAYLFAVVGGDLDLLEDSFTTMTGRIVALKIFLDKGRLPHTAYAMEALKKSMAWDEKIYGREYQLDVFNIVAVGDFNMGAMENTGLNIFNTKYVLADADTATDTDFIQVEAVIAHEYFHNWSGNRVTVRDWFQLSLKEGFTVFRDQEFTSDHHNRTLKRIADVERLKRSQFIEDAGPLAHPIRPDSYEEINNFYTATVYEKGAEIVRMVHTLLGPQKFRAGSDLYFDRHDGQAVTCEEFIAAMEDANSIDLKQFRIWYAQAGTPRVAVTDAYDAVTKTYSLNFKQSTPPTPDQPSKAALHMPVAMSLMDAQGKDIPGTTRVLELHREEETFTFENIAAKPVTSLFRGFSAPVILQMKRSSDELLFLSQYESDPFNRVEAMRLLAKHSLQAMLDDPAVPLQSSYYDAVTKIFAEDDLDPALKAELLSLPVKSIFAQDLTTIDVEGITRIYHRARADLSAAFLPHWRENFESMTGKMPYEITGTEIAKRILKNFSLSYLTISGEALDEAMQQFQTADNMTDRFSALALLLRDGGARGEEALVAFYENHRDNALVMDKWFGLQAAIELPDRLRAVEALTKHPDFTLKNPNRVYALIGSFAGMISPDFHALSGEGYAFLADIVGQLDATNPSVAARMVGPLLQWRRYDDKRQGLMRQSLERVAARPAISKNVGELVGKSLTLH